MSMRRIRQVYSVPAKRGGRVVYTGESGRTRYGTITGTSRSAMHLVICLDGDDRSGYFHPTWELEYLT